MEQQQEVAAAVVGERVVADSGEVNAPIARRLRNRHRRPILPPRPKKPPTGYTMFLRNYFNTHPAQAGTSTRGEMFTRAGQQWRDLPEERKQEFRHLCLGEQERYRNEMAVWNGQRTALKRPPSAYCLFLKDFYQSERAGGNGAVKGNVVEVGKRIKLEWDNLTPERKNEYKVQYQNAQIAYRQRMTDIEQGNVQVEDHVNGVVKDDNNGGQEEKVDGGKEAAVNEEGNVQGAEGGAVLIM